MECSCVYNRAFKKCGRHTEIRTFRLCAGRDEDYYKEGKNEGSHSALGLTPLFERVNQHFPLGGGDRLHGQTAVLEKNHARKRRDSLDLF